MSIDVEKLKELSSELEDAARTTRDLYYDIPSSGIDEDEIATEITDELDGYIRDAVRSAVGNAKVIDVDDLNSQLNDLQETISDLSARLQALIREDGVIPAGTTIVLNADGTWRQQ